jgi:hypothetical protein
MTCDWTKWLEFFASTFWEVPLRGSRGGEGGNIRQDMEMGYERHSVSYKRKLEVTQYHVRYHSFILFIQVYHSASSLFLITLK